MRIIASEREVAARRRSAQLIERADEILAEPRPVYDEHELWRAPSPEIVRRLAPAQPAPQPRPSAAPSASRSWVNGTIDKAMDALIRGVSSFVVQQRDALRPRHAESERRLADLEQRVAELERSR